jgi:hypothetical protein
MVYMSKQPGASSDRHAVENERQRPALSHVVEVMQDRQESKEHGGRDQTRTRARRQSCAGVFGVSGWLRALNFEHPRPSI